MERFTISLDDKLAREFDDWAAERGVHHGKLNLISVELHQPHRHDHGLGSARHVHLKPAS